MAKWLKRNAYVRVHACGPGYPTSSFLLMPWCNSLDVTAYNTGNLYHSAVQVLAALLLIQIPANVPSKATEEPQQCLDPCLHPVRETWMEFQDPGLGLAQPQTL